MNATVHIIIYACIPLFIYSSFRACVSFSFSSIFFVVFPYFFSGVGKDRSSTTHCTRSLINPLSHVYMCLIVQYSTVQYGCGYGCIIMDCVCVCVYGPTFFNYCVVHFVCSMYRERNKDMWICIPYGERVSDE